MIKAINTFYKGNYYRSRLEAKWAVYFDFLGVEYQYEPEGYALSNGQKYLPDFYLPVVGIYVEVKPSNYKNEDETKHKCFVLDGRKTLLIAVGHPSRDEYEVYSLKSDVVFKYDPVSKKELCHTVYKNKVEIERGRIVIKGRDGARLWYADEYSDWMDLDAAIEHSAKFRFEHL